MPVSVSATAKPAPNFVTLLPIVAVAFILFLVTGIALPVLPLYVHRDLGLGTFVVGLVAGAQFSAALLSRFWSGQYADTRGTSALVVLCASGVAARLTKASAVHRTTRNSAGWKAALSEERT
jgi:hypothetical protein